MALLGRRAQAARAETSNGNGGHVKTVGGTKVATGPNGNTAVKQTKAGVGKILCCFYHLIYIVLYIVWISNISICCNDLFPLYISIISPLLSIDTTTQIYINDSSWREWCCRRKANKGCRQDEQWR